MRKICFIFLLLLTTSVYADINEDFIEASKRGSIRFAKRYLNNGADVNAADWNKRTALIWAVKSSDAGMVKWLLEQGADINLKDNDGRSALTHAIKESSKEVVDLLMASGSDLKEKNKKTSSNLHEAANNNLVSVIKELLDSGVNINSKNKNGDTALLLAVSNDANQAAELLIDRGANLKFIKHEQGNALHIAVKRKNLSIVKKLIAAGLDVNLKDSEGRTAFHWAASLDKSDREKMQMAKDLSQVLLDAGANVNAKSNFAETAVKNSVETDESLDYLFFLASQGAFDKDKENNNAALMVSTLKHKHDMTLLLLEYGLDPNVRNSYGQTPLHIAFDEASTESAVYLLDFFAKMDIKDKKGRLPEDYSRQSYLLEFAKKLKVCDPCYDNRSEYDYGEQKIVIVNKGQYAMKVWARGQTEASMVVLPGSSSSMDLNTGATWFLTDNGNAGTSFYIDVGPSYKYEVEIK